MKLAPALLLVAWLPLLDHAAAQSPRVRLHDLVERGAVASPSSPPALEATAPCTDLAALAFHGQPVPGGGTLAPGAFFNPASITPSGRIAFFAQVNGSPRNQGIFTADAGGLHPIAMGCGAGGGSGVPSAGCGDATPLGGTYGGMFSGTFFAPVINRRGDVLFLADVEGGSSTRALFLYRSATQQVETVAAIGGPAPQGATFTAVGPGNLNDLGTVAFLARTGGGTDSDLYLWKGGVPVKVVAVGDPSPVGGTFALIGTESLGFVDGTQVPVGPLPGLNDLDQLTFRGILSGASVSRGIFLSQGGVHQLLVAAGDPAPGGGTIFDFQAAMLNDAGEIAFFADYQPTPTSFSSGWFAGTPGSLRKALAFFDPLDDPAICFGLAFSRNPMTPLDEQGNVLLWTDAQLPGGAMEERLVISGRDGHVTTAARKGQPTPLGGALGTFDAWPSMNERNQMTISASVPGSSSLSAHLVATGVLTWFDEGFAKPGALGAPQLQGEGALLPGTPGQIALAGAAPNAQGLLFAGFSKVNLPLLGGTFVPSPDLGPFPFLTDATGSFVVAWPAWPAAVPSCLDLWFQAWIADPTALFGAAASNGLRALPQ